MNRSDGARASGLSFVLLDPYGRSVTTSSDSIIMTQYNESEGDSYMGFGSWIKKVRATQGIANFSTTPMDMPAPTGSLSKSIPRVKYII